MNRAIVPRNVGRRGVEAELQRSNVCDDRPAVMRRDLIRVRRHHSRSIRDDVEKMIVRRCSQSIDVKRWRRQAESPACGHPLSGSEMVVTGCAKDLESFAAALEYIHGYRKRDIRRGLDPFESLRDRSFGKRTRRGAVREEPAFAIWLVKRLICHVLSARCQACEKKQNHP